jgi:dienelactone hydrolase
MSCVPLPWWTSQSTIATRAAPPARAAAAAAATLLSRQNPIARSGVAWCPGGRTTAMPWTSAPRIASMASWHTEPAAARAASQVPGEK